jgi:ParB family chromosome partitioning protein
MAKKRPKLTLTQPIKPRTGDLERLFTADGDTEQASGLHLLSVRLEAIRPDPEQPRRSFPTSSLEELSDSIRQEGVIQPIEVMEIAPNHYLLVHGERRWRAAQMAGLESIPAVVQRHEYDDTTRLVRQLVENIQREDLNDVDRAAGLLRLRELLQVELDARVANGSDEVSTSPWSKTITWAKVGKRLGMTRQRIHQLIRLLELPDEIKNDVRDGRLSERETRIYQGLQRRQQRTLHRARYKKELSRLEIRNVVLHLKEEPGTTISQAIREVRNPITPITEPPLDTSFGDSSGTAGQSQSTYSPATAVRTQSWSEGTILPPRQTRPTNIDRLDWIRGHLARIQRQGMSASERNEIIRLLTLIQQDISSLMGAMESVDLLGDDRQDGAE